MRRVLAGVSLALIGLVANASIARAQGAEAETKAVLAVADSVLLALTTGDNAMLKRFSLDSAIVGGVGLRDGVERFSFRPMTYYSTRSGPSTFTERGFGGTARVQDRVAQVWLPYDLYTGANWSHCGVDTFSMMKIDGRWRVASLIYTIEQPPACKKHPSGPPK